MTLNSASAHRATRKNPLTASLVVALAIPVVAVAWESARFPHASDLANGWYPLRPAAKAYKPRTSDSSQERASSTPPGTPLVTCDDSGLRTAIANASSGDAINLTACSTITLTAGDIFVNVDDLTLNGPGAGQLTIDGGLSAYSFGRVFRHTGFGTLSINGMTLGDAEYAGLLPGSNVRGGCIYSAGSVSLNDAVVTGCTLAAFTADYAIGGAIYSRGNLTLVDSTIKTSLAYSTGNEAEGGGVFVRGDFTATESSIVGNTVIAPSSYARGGGVVVLGTGDFAMLRSTLSGNAAEFSGGAYVNTTGKVDLINSTISANYASLVGGGGTFVPTATLTNSTVTENVAGFGVGLYGYQLTLQGTILADNLDATGAPTDDVYAGAIGGGNNLIVTTSSTIPADTIRACPRLTPLQDNGGPTLTHKPIAGSPAIDAGNNTIPVATDQRSTGFPRTFGSKTDIGAVEWQGELDNEIFKSAFEVRCDEY